MASRSSKSRMVFNVVNYLFLMLMAILCVLPLINVLATSLSSSSAATAGQVTFWPVEFTLKSYEFMLNKPEFLRSVWITVQRVVLGTVVSMGLTLLIAFPLSKTSSRFRFRTLYVWLFVFTILFNGGLVPWYLTIRNLGLLDSIWALVLPGAVPVFNVILLINFFRGLPRELDEAALIDGAGHWGTLWRIYVPLSLPAMATLVLLTVVGHWNSWFDGLILMNSPTNYPLSTYLQTVIVSQNLTTLTADQMKDLAELSNRTVQSAQIFLAALPILLLYPFLQKYFVKGLTLGAVKG